MDIDEPYLGIEVGGLRRNVSDLEGSFKRSVRISIPTDVPTHGLARAQVDLEILAERLRENGGDVLELLQAFLAGKNSEVERLVKGLGLTESDFQERGGGFFWVVVIVGVLCCASEAY